MDYVGEKVDNAKEYAGDMTEDAKDKMKKTKRSA